MSQETRTIKASCLCGTFNHDITLPSSAFPLTGDLCHCTSCRRMTGALALSVAFLPEPYTIPEAVVDKLKPFVFSKRITEYFCPTCGAQVLARCLKDGDDPISTVTWDVSSGALEKLDGVVKFRAHIHIQDTVDGGLTEFMPSTGDNLLKRWPADRQKGEELPLHWTASERSSVKCSSSDMLHGSCKCKGTQFYVARPSSRSALSGKYYPSTPPDDCPDSELPPESETIWLRANRTKFLSGLCVCNSCRLASGMEITSWAFVPPCDIFLDKEGKQPIPHSMDFGTVKAYDSSPGIRHYFCHDCGATLFYNADDRRHFTDIAMGVLNAPEGARAENWFEWRGNGIDFIEDADHRAKEFARSVQKGFEEWQKNKNK